MLPVAGIAITISALTALLFAEARKNRSAIWITKPLASLGFIIAALGFGALDSMYGILILSALVLSFIGDVFLIPKKGFPFFIGLASFGCAHAAYAAAFLVHGINPSVAIAGAVMVAIFFILIGKWLYPCLPENKHIPFWIYFFVIGAMVSIAVGCTFGGGPVTIITGAVLFTVSDIAVARNRFVAPGFSNKLWGLPLYYMAQHILASTIGQV